MNIRAKFRCTQVTHRKHTPNADENAVRQFEFDAIYDDSVPEDRRYARYTPAGKLTVTVDNPAVDWEPGKSYYLDFTPVDEA